MDRHNTREKCEGDWWMCPLTGFVWVRFVARWPLPSPNGQQDEVSIAKSQTCPPEPEFVCEPSLLSGLEDIKHLSSSLCSQSYFMSLLHLVNSQSLGNSQNYNFSRNHVWMWELVHEEGWVPKNWWTVVLEKTLESPLDCKEVKPVNLWLPLPEYSLEGLILTWATWCEELTHWTRLWCQEKLKAGGEGDDRGWDGWMASPTQWTWVWSSSGIQWRTELLCCSPWSCKELDTTSQLNNNFVGKS